MRGVSPADMAKVKTSAMRHIPQTRALSVKSMLDHRNNANHEQGSARLVPLMCGRRQLPSGSNGLPGRLGRGSLPEPNASPLRGNKP